MRGAKRRYVVYGTLLFAGFLLMLFHKLSCETEPWGGIDPRISQNFFNGKDNQAPRYDNNMSLIFIGGMPRSGTTLMRAMLDAHPDVRCGEETHLIPLVLNVEANWWEGSRKNRERLEGAGITSEVLDAAMSAFILEIITGHGEAAPRLANKDPFTMKYSVYLGKLFPNAKFLMMLRDGRAVGHSLITRHVKIKGLDLNSYNSCLSNWDRVNELMYSQCIQLGADRCMPVYYEQLVLHKELWMRRISKFLNVPWNESVLHHEDYIGKAGGISVSKLELSSNQITKPVNLEGLSKWVGKLPQDVIEEMPQIAPMLKTLGYDPLANPPDYSNPPRQVSDNTLHLQQDVEFWKQRDRELRQRRKKTLKKRLRVFTAQIQSNKKFLNPCFLWRLIC